MRLTSAARRIDSCAGSGGSDGLRFSPRRVCVPRNQCQGDRLGDPITDLLTDLPGRIPASSLTGTAQCQRPLVLYYRLDGKQWHL